ncbi:putative membrane protein [Mucilaginibacter frigoritolerans]|jgi:uncharacterized membrane protein|uniref:Putative membrane protein n=1 Tax=Mucilaginibacter frigoritolerans TaxID=652788 RepID=A0A562UFD0_9SPHI|nr:DUF1345 domain-containing protein [Mucilaginibacter frigoritolerans]TWJ04510.1 putative membrane protein [Mucilaginibacter frigoritolerans]
MTKNLKADKRLFFRLDAHYRLMIAFGVSVVFFFLLQNNHSLPALILFTWISFASTIILLDWIIIATSHPREVRKIAKLQDFSRTLIFLFVLAASLASMGAIVFLLKSAKGHPTTSVNDHILLAIAAVIISWWLVHTIFTLLYAHLFYDTDTDDGAVREIGGLEFPGKEDPDYFDFVYFSFVIGMTFQVSDVEISSRKIRRFALLHALLSFTFNTAILALSINVISGMIAQ